MKVGTPTLDQYGFITFLSNAHLDLYYAPESATISPPTPTLSPTLNPTPIPTLYVSGPTSNPTSNSIQNVGSISLDSTNIAILSIVIGLVVILSLSIYRNRTAKKK